MRIRGRSRRLVDIHIGERTVVIVPKGLMKVLSFRRQMAIPLSRIAACTASSRPDRDRPIQARICGTSGAALCAGYLRVAERRSWWVHRYGEGGVIVDVAGGPLPLVVFDVPDPVAVARTIKDARARADS